MNEEIDIASGPKQNSQDFCDRVKGLEAKFRGELGSGNHQKPKVSYDHLGSLGSKCNEIDRFHYFKSIFFKKILTNLKLYINFKLTKLIN